MPTYDYQCRSCGTVTELIHSMLEAGPSTCEKCGGELRRVLFPAGIIFKGSGFYRNDSRASASQGASTEASESKSKSDSAEKGPGSSGDGKAGSTSSDGGGSTSEPKSASSEKP